MDYSPLTRISIPQNKCHKYQILTYLFWAFGEFFSRRDKAGFRRQSKFLSVAVIVPRCGHEATVNSYLFANATRTRVLLQSLRVGVKRCVPHVFPPRFFSPRFQYRVPSSHPVPSSSLRRSLLRLVLSRRVVSGPRSRTHHRLPYWLTRFSACGGRKSPIGSGACRTRHAGTAKA